MLVYIFLCVCGDEVLVLGGGGRGGEEGEGGEREGRGERKEREDGKKTRRESFFISQNFHLRPATKKKRLVVGGAVVGVGGSRGGLSRGGNGKGGRCQG